MLALVTKEGTIPLFNSAWFLFLYIHSAHFYKLTKESSGAHMKGFWVLSGVLPAGQQTYVSNCECGLEGPTSAYVGICSPQVSC